MKKILVVLFTIFCSTNIIAQILGDGGKNDSIAVQDTIVLPLNLPDEYRRLLEDRRSDNINSDYETMKPTRSLNNFYAVGTIIGEANVSQTGGATYQIPIEVPKGVAGFQPDISISYSSQSGAGLLGYGWSLNASSFITRIGKSYYYDGITESPDLSNTDNLILDGQRLILSSGTNFVNGAKYRTEIEGYSDITYKIKNARAYLEVRTRDGRVLEYGSTDDSSVEAFQSGPILFWLLSKVTDKIGCYLK